MKDVNNKTIFLAALDWGLGHATRCVPVVRALLKNNNTVILGVTSFTNKIFEEEFPELQKVNLPEFNIKYSAFLPVWLKLISDWKRVQSVIRREKTELEKIVSKHRIDVVISDSRFGLYSSRTHNVLISHQLFLKSPFAGYIAQNFNKKYVLNFDEVWIPDHESAFESLSGDLAHGAHYHPNVKFIGPQSRLQKSETIQAKYDYLFLLSGPEPQHTIIAQILVKKAAQYPHLNFALASHVFMKEEKKNVKFFNALSPERLSEIIAMSNTIICRSGYSTLMDLHLLSKKNLILVPTPGQTEQEYLAKYWAGKFFAASVSQKKIYSLDLAGDAFKIKTGA